MASDPLEEEDQEELEQGFPPPERKVVTQSYDLSVRTLIEQWEGDQILLPDFQREYVWDDRRASRLVESLLLNIPIPVLYFAETPAAQWEVIDGQQRITSVARYVENQFALRQLLVLSELSRRRYHELPDREQRFLTTRTMRAVVISAESHPNMKFEIFERLNTGSLDLNAQELRNSLYRGPFNSLLRELVHERAYREAIGTATPRRRMRDEEFVLRFFALRSALPDYRPPLKRFLNEYMRSVRSAKPDALETLRSSFQRTVERIARTLGANAFRTTDRAGRPIEKTPNVALFDAQMLAFSWVTDDDALHTNRERVATQLNARYARPEFVDAIRLATGDRSRTLTRVRGAVAALEEAGVPIDAPEVVSP